MASIRGVRGEKVGKGHIGIRIGMGVGVGDLPGVWFGEFLGVFVGTGMMSSW